MAQPWESAKRRLSTDVGHPSGGPSFTGQWWFASGITLGVPQNRNARHNHWGGCEQAVVSGRADGFVCFCSWTPCPRADFASNLAAHRLKWEAEVAVLARRASCCATRRWRCARRAAMKAIAAGSLTTCQCLIMGDSPGGHASEKTRFVDQRRSGESIVRPRLQPKAVLGLPPPAYGWWRQL